MHLFVIVAALFTFIVPLIQLSIGFNYVVKDGTKSGCHAAPDLPLLMAIGGVFPLFFLGIAYGLLKMFSVIGDQESDVSGKTPKFLVGFVSCCFGAISLIFFILIQDRVYGAYSNNVQFNNQSANNYCQQTVMLGALAMIVMTYIAILFFIAIYAFVLLHTYHKKRPEIPAGEAYSMSIIATRL